jgi:predicted nuclease with TOPRIM domain
MSEDTAASIVVELEQKRILEKQVREQELLIENLQKQIDLLKMENSLLKEQTDLLKEQVSLYRVRVQDAENELSRQRVWSFFDKLQMIGVGIAVGVILMLVAH